MRVTGVRVFMLVGIYACGGQRSMSAPQLLTHWATLIGWWVPRARLSLLPQPGDYKHMTPCQSFHTCAEDPNSGPYSCMVNWGISETLCGNSWTHTPSPSAFPEDPLVASIRRLRWVSTATLTFHLSCQLVKLHSETFQGSCGFPLKFQPTFSFLLFGVSTLGIILSLWHAPLWWYEQNLLYYYILPSFSLICFWCPLLCYCCGHSSIRF